MLASEAAKAKPIRVPLRSGATMTVREVIGNDFTTTAYQLTPPPKAKRKRKAARKS